MQAAAAVISRRFGGKSASPPPRPPTCAARVKIPRRWPARTRAAAIPSATAIPRTRDRARGRSAAAVLHVRDRRPLVARRSPPRPRGAASTAGLSCVVSCARGARGMLFVTCTAKRGVSSLYILTHETKRPPRPPPSRTCGTAARAIAAADAPRAASAARTHAGGGAAPWDERLCRGCRRPSCSRRRPPRRRRRRRTAHHRRAQPAAGDQRRHARRAPPP